MFWPIIASAIGAGFQAFSAERTNSVNQQLARENREFQAQMSNTAHQREMADYSAAGLNPILAGSTGGASGTTQGAPTMQDTLAPAISTAMQGLQLIQAQKAIEQQDARIENESKMTEANVNKAVAESAKTYADIGMFNYSAKDYEKRWDKLTADTTGQNLKNIEQRSENMRRGVTDKMLWKPTGEASDAILRPWNKYKGVLTEPFSSLVPRIANDLLQGSKNAISNAKQGMQKNMSNPLNPFGF